MGGDKLVKATQALVLAGDGRLFLPEGGFPFPDSCPLDVVKAEVLRFTGGKRQDAHDDIVDTLSMAAKLATRAADAADSFRPYVAGAR